MLVNTIEDYNKAKVHLNAQDSELSWDTETDGLEYEHSSHIVGVGVNTRGKSFYMPFRHGEGQNLPEPMIRDLFGTVITPQRKQLGFHLGFDIKMARKEGQEPPQFMEDAILNAHLLNENELSFKMESLAAKYIDPSYANAEDELTDHIIERFGGSRKKAKQHLWKLPPEQVAAYGCQDVETNVALRNFQTPHLASWELTELAQEVADFQLAICEMQLNGVPIDVKMVNAYNEEAAREAAIIEARIQEKAGYPINPRSPKQLKAWLGTPGTAKDILEPAAERGLDGAQDILDYRGWHGAGSRYYKPYLHHVTEHGLLHPGLRVTGTGTGRLSCSDPNLQAVPRGSNEYKVKDVFVAPEGWDIVEWDLSQAEIRVMAHYTRDPKLLEIIEKGLNMHDVVAREQELERDVAKRLNFSAQYGIGAAKFSETYGYPLSDSRVYLRKYREMFPGMKRLQNACDAKGKKNGFIRLYTGRVRHFDGRRSQTYKGSSSLVQGAVAEMIRIAITRIHKELPDIRLILTVHDSILGLVPKGKYGNQLARQAATILEHQPWCSVPAIADIKKGPSWGTAKELKAA